MAKKIRFPLNLAEGKQARDLTELREFFSLPEVLGYVANGKLVTWLNDRYESDLADEISALDFSDSDFEQQICDVLGVEYPDNGTTLKDAQARNEKLAKLKQFTDDKAILNAVDSVAFDQEELNHLLEQNHRTLYLCGETFTITMNVDNVTYIGVNQPTVVISSGDVAYFEQHNIRFNNVLFPEGLKSVLKPKAEQRKYEELHRTQNEERKREHQRREEQRKQEELHRTQNEERKREHQRREEQRKQEELHRTQNEERKREHQRREEQRKQEELHRTQNKQREKERQEKEVQRREEEQNEPFHISCGGLMAYKGRNTSVVIPDTVTIIKANAFYGCHTVRKVTVPSSVKTIETGAFSNCKSLHQVIVQGGGTYLQRDALPSRVLVNDTSYGSNAQPVLNIKGRNTGKKETFVVSHGALMRYEGTTSSVVIPNTVKLIKANAFHGCHSMTKVTIPSSVKIIESRAFTNCKSLHKVHIQGSDTTIYAKAFPSHVFINGTTYE